MIQRELREELEKILPSARIRYDEPMARHCSFRTGGPADVLAAVRTEAEMTALLRLLNERQEAFFLLGKGTNLLIGDGGFRGVIVTASDAALPEKDRASAAAGQALRAQQSGAQAGAGTGSEETEIESDTDTDPDTDPDADEGSELLGSVRVHGNRVTAGAGATLKAAAMAAMEHGLTGLEFAAGIPGTVGGGLVMNAGAYGGEMKQVVESVRLLMPDGSLRVCSGQEMEFGYRTSILRRVPATALRAEFVLQHGDREAVRARIAELAAERRKKQPLEYPSAGSTFKRPEGYFAGKLIMDAGLAGYSVGGAQVSEKHCGFVINRGGATSSQIRTLIEDVRKRVYEENGILLEPEVIFLGEF